MNIIPYPQKVRNLPGISKFDNVVVELPEKPDPKERLAADLILARLKGKCRPSARVARISIGSVTTLEDKNGWLNAEEGNFLSNVVSDQAYVLSVNKGKVLIVGKTALGALYGAQTFLQSAQKIESGEYVVQNTRIMDFPAVEKRFLAIAMSWYAGYGRIGFASQLWKKEGWLWFINWCLEHKINGINLCIYGYYPFRFNEYPESEFRDVEMTTWLGEIAGEIKIKYTHPNIRDEFLPEMIRYANERGIIVLCYFGLNTFNGGYALAHPESRYYSDNPEKFNQFKYNLCPSRKDVKEYLDASIRKLLTFGFNGFVFEESEGSGFCECASCRKSFYGEDSRDALHKASYELFNRFYSIIKKERSDSIVGIRMWRMGSEAGVDYLRKEKVKIPSDTLIFWSNAMDRERFKGWVEVFGPERITGQDAETLGFSALYDGLIFMFPEQYSSYVKYVNPKYKPSYPQSLPNDVKQFEEAARAHCGGVMGYAFNWNGWELAPLCLAQFAWNPKAFTLDKFVKYAYEHQFGSVAGKIIARAISLLPIVLENRVCEGSKKVPRDDPVSGGLAGLTSLQVPSEFGEGEHEIRALHADLGKASLCLRLLQKVPLEQTSEQNRISIKYFRNAITRTVFICRAAIEYRKALSLEKKKSPAEIIASHLSKSLFWLKKDHRIVLENAFDATEEFHERITFAIENVSRKLAIYEEPRSP